MKLSRNLFLVKKTLIIAHFKFFIEKSKKKLEKLIYLGQLFIH